MEDPIDRPQKDKRVESVDVIQPEDDSSGEIIFYLRDGRRIGVPLSWSWKLLEAEPEQRENHEISPSGYRVRWPEVDEDLTPESLLNGGPTKRPEPVEEGELAERAWPPGRIKKLREDLGLRQGQFAKKVGVSRQATVSNWETGDTTPSKTAMRVLDLLASRIWGQHSAPEINNPAGGKEAGISEHHERVKHQL